ncbi:MAG: chemotaxis protein CheW [Oscillospiraceae bacterium]|jgi:chemotaxis signal transduction protein|nr:chemotaxis protein CheW [Oscillospiraceae bacterium]
MNETVQTLAVEEIEGQDALETGDLPWILFTLDGVAYGINSQNVLSIEIFDHATPIVGDPPYMRGVTRFREGMIPLADLRVLFGLPDRERTTEAELRDMVIVVQWEENRRMGLVVDEILSVEFINSFVESHTGASRSQYVDQIARREKDDTTVMLLDETLLANM